MYEFIVNKKLTNFYKIFCSEELDYREKLFVNENWQFAFFKLDSFLFNEKNKVFMSNFCAFFNSENATLYIAPGEPIEEIFDGYGYHTIKFSSQINFLELPYEIPDPDGQNLATNWTGDFLWNQEGTWGICHDRDNFLFILGYSQKIRTRVETYLLSHSNKVPYEKLCKIIDDLYPFQNTEE